MKLKRPFDKHAFTHTSAQLDAAVTTFITILLTGFIVGEKYLNVSGINKGFLVVASVVAIAALMLHFLSFVTAHYTQYMKVNHKKLSDSLNTITVVLNAFVQFVVLVMFGFVIYIIIKGE